MMARKERRFAPLIQVSLGELVPQDHFYRHLEGTFDLSFVRDFVHETYASKGRPSIDPVVFFKLQLVMFFEGSRSERQLMQHAADRLSVRWYIGYDLGEPLPDHSSLTRIRKRYSVDVFRRFFEKIVELCQAAGLVWGKELYFDGTKVAANAGKESLKPRFYVDAHLNGLFGEAFQSTEQKSLTEERAGGAADEQEERPAPAQLPTSLSAEEQEHLARENTQRHDWIEELGAQDRQQTSRGYQRVADLQVSTTDPDATLMLTKNGADLGYHTHYVVDGGKSRIILNVLVMPSEVMDNQPMLDLLWRTRFRWKLWPRQVTGDKKYGTEDNLVAIEDQGICAYIPSPDFDHRTQFFSAGQFRYEAERDVYVQQAKNCALIGLIPLSVPVAIGPMRRTAIIAHSKPSVRRANRDAVSVVVWMRPAWIASAPTSPPKRTRRPCASAVSGSNRCSPKPADWHGMRRFRLRRHGLLQL